MKAGNRYDSDWATPEDTKYYYQINDVSFITNNDQVDNSKEPEIIGEESFDIEDSKLKKFTKDFLFNPPTYNLGGENPDYPPSLINSISSTSIESCFNDIISEIRGYYNDSNTSFSSSSGTITKELLNSSLVRLNKALPINYDNLSSYVVKINENYYVQRDFNLNNLDFDLHAVEISRKL